MGELELRGLTKRYGGTDDGTTAVADLDMTVADGEFVVLVGPSGCGKSTTLRMIAGLESATDGEVRLDGRDITREEPQDRDVAMVFQNYALYPHKSAYENMAFGLRMSTDLDRSEIDERVRETAEMLEIDGLLDTRPDELSGGQQQRVALGRAIVREPEVFLMDEPLSNLDAKLRTQMRTELQTLHRELGVTTVYVTHDQTEAMTMGDRIVVLRDGRLQQCASPLTCYNRPTNRFVAGFIGSPSMNFLDVTQRDGRLVHEAVEYSHSGYVDDHLDGVAGRTADLCLGVRPEDVDVDPDDQTTRLKGQAATVETVEPTGDVTVVSMTIGDTSITASAPGELDVNPGDRVDLGVNERAIYLFDNESGRAVMTREKPVTAVSTGSASDD